MPITSMMAIGSVLLVIFFSLDIMAALDPIKGNTWSEIIRDSTVLIWLLSVCLGHITHPGEKMEPVFDNPGKIIWLVYTTLAVIVISVVTTKLGYSIPPWAPVPIGIICGALWWPV